MPLHAFRCACGALTERLVPIKLGVVPSEVPCERCGAAALRVISAPAVIGRARLPRPASAAPRSWIETNRGDRELITAWHRELDARACLEERHPELAEARQPVRAHEHPAAFQGPPSHHHAAVDRSSP
jgi:hypothetical protein